MSRRDGGLIEQIQRGALDSAIPLADTLRKCVALGGQTRSADLRDWAVRELNGYGPEDELPQWRIINAPLHIDGIKGNFHVKNMMISSWDLPDFAREHVTEELHLVQGVGMLEALIRNARGNSIELGPYMSADLVKYMNHVNQNPYQHIERLYWSVSTSSVSGVLDRIRTSLTSLVAELRHGMGDVAAFPSAEVATNAVQFVVTGKRNRVTVNSAQAGGHGTSEITERPAEAPPGWRRWARIGGGLVGVAGVVAAVFAVLQYLATP